MQEPLSLTDRVHILIRFIPWDAHRQQFLEYLQLKHDFLSWYYYASINQFYN